MLSPVLFTTLLLAGSVTPTAQEEVRPPLGPYIWISRHELQGLPTSGPEWSGLLLDANRPLVPNIADHDDKVDTYVMAAGLVWLRERIGSYRDRVRTACMDVAAVIPPDENDPYSDAWSRNLTGYVIAAGLVGLTPAQDLVFKGWLGAALPHIRRVHRRRPNNFGTHAGAARAAIAIYLGDAAEEQASWDVFRRWLGDDSSPFNFDQNDWGGSECMLAWQGEPYPHYFGINRPGATGFACPLVPHALPNPFIARDIGGVLPDDQRRSEPSSCACNPPSPPGSCCFRWPPKKTNYVYEALQGVLAQAVIHARRGRDPWSIAPDPLNGHGAILRAFEWLRDAAGHPIDDPENGQDDYWQAYVVNRVYGQTPAFLPLPELPSAIVGKAVAYADWTTLNPSWP